MMKFPIIIVYLNLIYNNGLYSTKAQNSRITGGYEVTDIANHPYTAVLIDQFGPTTTFLCACAKVTRNHVLTTGDCITPRLNSALNHGTLMVRGNTLKWGEYGGDDHDVVKVTKHVNYTKTALDYDVAVIKVHQPFGDVTWLKIPRVDMYQKGKYVTVLGWGTRRMEGGGPVMKELFYVNLPITEWSECKRNFKGQFTSRMFCAGIIRHGPCTHDTGGPVVGYKKGNKFLIGLVSFTHNGLCGVSSFSSVFTNLYSMADWIWKTIKEVDGDDDDDDRYDNKDKKTKPARKKKKKYLKKATHF